MFDGKVLIKRLPSFSVPKITVIRHVKPILKLQQTWQTRTVLWKTARTLNNCYSEGKFKMYIVTRVFEWKKLKDRLKIKFKTKFGQIYFWTNHALHSIYEQKFTQCFYHHISVLKFRIGSTVCLFCFVLFFLFLFLFCFVFTSSLEGKRQFSFSLNMVLCF